MLPYNPNTIFATALNILPKTISTYLNGMLQTTTQRTYRLLYNAAPVMCKYGWDPFDELKIPAGCSAVGSYPIYRSTPDREDTYDGQGTLLRSTVNMPQFAADATGQYAYLNLLDLVAYSEVLDGSGNVASITNYGYDDPSGGPSGIHGNLTSTTAGGYTSQIVYNNNGMPQTTIDPRGTHAQITYQCSGLYPQTVTFAYGKPEAETVTYGYDCTSGWLQSVQDPNDLVNSKAGTVYSYDSFGSLLSIDYPDKGRVSKSYNGYTLPVTVTTTTTASPDPNVVASVVYDGFGRPVQNTLPNGATVETTYDSQGRVASVSNPHFGTPSSTDGTTTYSYDALGRMTTQTASNRSSIQTWTYNGDLTTYTDEDQNQWQRTSDVLGRLTEVLEPNGASHTPSIETDYSYDVLNNLLSVKQWGGALGSSGARNRFFTYDSMSRLVCSSNPESSSVTCPATATAAYTPGTTGYSYDANGNVQSKTDARGVTANYAYDGLNRLQSITYSGSVPGGSLSSCFQYGASGTGNQIGRLVAQWTQSGSCSQAPPAYPGYQSLRLISAYDAMGRITSEQQCVLGFCTSSAAPAVPATPNCASLPAADGLSYCYDLAGNLTAYSNGLNSSAFPQQNILLSQSFDTAGRLASVGVPNTSSTPWIGNQLPACLFNAQGPGATSPWCNQAPTQPAYTPFGSLQNWMLGTNLNLTRSYDNRLRVTGETAAQQ